MVSSNSKSDMLAKPLQRALGLQLGDSRRVAHTLINTPIDVLRGPFQIVPVGAPADVTIPFGGPVQFDLTEQPRESVTQSGERGTSKLTNLGKSPDQKLSGLTQFAFDQSYGRDRVVPNLADDETDIADGSTFFDVYGARTSGDDLHGGEIVFSPEGRIGIVSGPARQVDVTKYLRIPHPHNLTPSQFAEGISFDASDVGPVDSRRPNHFFADSAGDPHTCTEDHNHPSLWSTLDEFRSRVLRQMEEALVWIRPLNPPRPAEAITAVQSLLNAAQGDVGRIHERVNSTDVRTGDFVISKGTVYLAADGETVLSRGGERESLFSLPEPISVHRVHDSVVAHQIPGKFLTRNVEPWSGKTLLVQDEFWPSLLENAESALRGGRELPEVSLFDVRQNDVIHAGGVVYWVGADGLAHREGVAEDIASLPDPVKAYRLDDHLGAVLTGGSEPEQVPATATIPVITPLPTIEDVAGAYWTGPGLPLFLGEAASGPVQIDPRENAHLLIAGEEGPSKTNLMRSIVDQRRTQGWNVAICALKDTDFDPLDNNVTEVAFDPMSAYDVILQFRDTLDRRRENTVEAKSFGRFPSYSPEVLVVDGLDVLITGSSVPKSVASKIVGHLEEIAKLGRPLAMHLVLTVPQANSSNAPSRLVQACSAFVALTRSSGAERVISWGPGSRGDLRDALEVAGGPGRNCAAAVVDDWESGRTSIRAIRLPDVDSDETFREVRRQVPELYEQRPIQLPSLVEPPDDPHVETIEEAVEIYGTPRGSTLLGEGAHRSVEVDPTKVPHLMIYGAPGSGTSNLTRALIEQRRGQGWQVLVGDMKGSDHEPAANVTVAHPEAEIIDLIRQARTELRRRTEEPKKGNDAESFTPLMLVVDNFDIFLKSFESDDDRAEAESLVLEICVLGRGHRVHFVGAAQRPDLYAETNGSRLRVRGIQSNCGSVVSANFAEPAVWQTVPYEIARRAIALQDRIPLSERGAAVAIIPDDGYTQVEAIRVPFIPARRESEDTVPELYKDDGTATTDPS